MKILLNTTTTKSLAAATTKYLLPTKRKHHTTSNQIGLWGTHYTLTATVNQHPPGHHEGWMLNGLKTVFCCVSVAYLTMVVSFVSFFDYLPTNNPQASRLLVGSKKQPLHMYKPSTYLVVMYIPTYLPM